MGAQSSKGDSTEETTQIGDDNNHQRVATNLTKITDIPTPEVNSGRSTPIATSWDPRSPSYNIARTPLEESILSSSHDDSIPDGGGKFLVISLDPRSPTMDFERTPIVIATTAPRKPVADATPMKSSVIPPKLLAISPVTTTTLSCINDKEKRKSFVGLLETNIDFIETNLDEAAAARNNSAKKLNKTLPSTDLLNTPVSNKLESQMKNLKLFEPAVRTPVNCEEKSTMTDDTTSGFKQETTNGKEVDKVIDITAHVKSFDRKLSTLIYQDQDEGNENHKINCKSDRLNNRNNKGSRTPLGTHNKAMNTNMNPKLKVSDRPRKSGGSGGSKIPILKDNLDRKKLGIQCENTPPRIVDGIVKQSNVSQWDNADKTLLI